MMLLVRIRKRSEAHLFDEVRATVAPFVGTWWRDRCIPPPVRNTVSLNHAKELVVEKWGVAERSKRWWRTVSGGSKAVSLLGASLIGVGGDAGSILPGTASVILVATGLACCGAGLLWGGLNLVAARHTMLTGPPRNDNAAALVHAHYAVRRGTLRDIDDVYELGVREVGVARHATQGQMRDFVSSCPDVLHIVERVGHQEPALVGYFMVYPLKSSTCDKILDHSIINGFGISASHLSRAMASASGLYIAQVLGMKPARDRAAVVLSLYEMIADTLNTAKRCKYVFARPGTPEGLRWMKAMGFEAIDEQHSQIWWLARPMISAYLARGGLKVGANK